MTVPNDTAVGRALESASVEFIDKKKEDRASAYEGELARTQNETTRSNTTRTQANARLSGQVATASKESAG